MLNRVKLCAKFQFPTMPATGQQVCGVVVSKPTLHFGEHLPPPKKKLSVVGKN